MKVYSIWKFVTCDLTGHRCGSDDDFPVHFPVTPNCKNCVVYKEFKASGKTVEEFREYYDEVIPKSICTTARHVIKLR